MLFSSRQDHDAGLLFFRPALKSFAKDKIPSFLGSYPGVILADMQAEFRAEGFCFMTWPVPEIGREFGKWIVIGDLVHRGKKRCVPCECQGCKNVFVVVIHQLWPGLSRQCLPCGRKTGAPRGSHGRPPEEHPRWKGGRAVTSHGYVLVHVGKSHPLAHKTGYAYEHRLKAWEAGLDITDKDVHHEDRVKDNNDNSNLKPLTIAEHHFEHRKPNCNLRLPGEPNETIECACGCGSTFLRFDAEGRPRRYLAPGHSSRGKTVSLETRRKMSASMLKRNQEQRDTEMLEF